MAAQSRCLTSDLSIRGLQFCSGHASMFHQCILHGLRKITVKIEEGPKGRNCDVRKLSLEHANKFANGFFSNFLPFVDDAQALTEEFLC